MKNLDLFGFQRLQKTIGEYLLALFVLLKQDVKDFCEFGEHGIFLLRHGAVFKAVDESLNIFRVLKQSIFQIKFNKGEQDLNNEVSLLPIVQKHLNRQYRIEQLEQIDAREFLLLAHTMNGLQKPLERVADRPPYFAAKPYGSILLEIAHVRKDQF